MRSAKKTGIPIGKGFPINHFTLNP